MLPKVLTDWLAIDYIVFGKPAISMTKSADITFKDWVDTKKLVLQEAYLEMVIVDNESLADAKELFNINEAYNMKKKKNTKKMVKKVAKKKASAAKKKAKTKMKKNMKKVKKSVKRNARKLREAFGLDETQSIKLATKLILAEEALKELLGDRQSIDLVLYEYAKMCINNPELI